ncbi:hypothetical protein HN011_006919 [Eciton burchellii]|nr:hypothetical protein HN011_006919 [Eciton burchellii]
MSTLPAVLEKCDERSGRFKRWKILLFVGVCALLLNVVPRSLHPSVTQLTEVHKCPACYGVSACRDVHRVELLWHDSRAIFSHLFGVKNVFYGTYDRRKVVLKKLAHSSELDAFDAVLCEKLGSRAPCFDLSIDRRTADFYLDLIETTIASDFSKDDSSRLRFCPTVRRLGDLLHDVYLNDEDVQDITESLINLWTLVSVNPEPLILQILSANHGWPVPEYLGACGRVIVEEYVGRPLSDYRDEPWLRRARIASSLLNAAHMFTFRNEQFGFYLTDISYDNIAVDADDVAKFIDLEHIIVVDKNPPQEDRPQKWQELDENTTHFHCPGCFAFSAEDICNHRVSDHNYYAICQLLSGSQNEDLFPGGFLRDMPVDVQQRYPNIDRLLQQCVAPTSSNSRIFFGRLLKTSLDAIVEGPRQ